MPCDRCDVDVLQMARAEAAAAVTDISQEVIVTSTTRQAATA